MADELEAAIERAYTPAPPAPIAGTLAPSPYNFEFAGDDALRVTVHNALAGVVVAIHYRMHDRDARIVASSATVAPTSDRAASVHELALGAGYLLNMSVFASSGAPRRGQTFVRVQIIRGRGAAGVVLGTIVQGYITASQDRAWPGSPIEGSLEGDGCARHLTGTDVSAGNEWSETVPAGARWELLTVQARLATDATVADRRPGLAYFDGSEFYFRSPQTSVITASDSLRCYWTQMATFNAAIRADVPIAPLPSGLILLAGHSIRAQTNNLQAGDNYFAPLIHVREWLEVQQ